jgi:hypothetical protein
MDSLQRRATGTQCSRNKSHTAIRMHVHALCTCIRMAVCALFSLHRVPVARRCKKSISPLASPVQLLPHALLHMHAYGSVCFVSMVTALLCMMYCALSSAQQCLLEHYTHLLAHLRTMLLMCCWTVRWL